MSRSVKRLASLALLLALLSPAAARALARVRGAPSYKPFDPIVLRAEGGTAKASYLWDVTSQGGAAQTVEAGGVLYVWATPGSYRVVLTAVDFDAKKIERSRFEFKVEGETPPGPVPPGPAPPVPPAPAGAFNRALVLYKDADRKKLPRAQDLILNDKSVHDLLKARTLKDADNPNGAWRVWDAGVDASSETKPWQDLLARGQGKALPWLILSNDAGVVHEGPLPASVPATLELLGKFAPKRKAG